jgi:acetoin utilization protein AcuB
LSLEEFQAGLYVKEPTNAVSTTAEPPWAQYRAALYLLAWCLLSPGIDDKEWQEIFLNTRREITLMQVEDYMHPRPITITAEELARTAYQRMRECRIRHLLVVTGQGRLVGVITDRDMRQASASDEPHMAEYDLTYLLEKMTVPEVMTRQVVTVRRQTPVAEAARIFLEKKFGCLPVVRDDNTLEGILTVTDLLRAYVAQHDPAHPTSDHPTWSGKERPLHVRDITPKEVVTAPPEMSLAQAQQCMRDKGIRHIPVVSGTQLVGIVTDRDIRAAMPSPATTLSRGEMAYQIDTTPISTCMTREVVAIGSHMDMAHAARLLLEYRFGCLPVVDAGTLVGVVTQIDCLRAFLALEEGSHADH